MSDLKEGERLTRESVKMLRPGDVIRYSNCALLCTVVRVDPRTGWVNYCGQGFEGGHDCLGWTFISRPSLEPPASDVAGWPTREQVAKVIDPAAFLFSPDELGVKDYHHPARLAFTRADAILALFPAPPHPASKEPG